MDMSLTVAPKSDQINADDLIAGPRTITVTRVNANEGNAEQPVNVYFDGDNGKPFRPCKSMRRVMIAVWGVDAKEYVGRSMTLYRDPDVTWGGMKVGGIRISHMSHMNGEQVLALTATKSSRKPYKVRPLKVEQKAAPAEKPVATATPDADDSAFDAPATPALVPVPSDGDNPKWADWLKTMGERIDAMVTQEDLKLLKEANETAIASLRATKETLADRLDKRFSDRMAELAI